MRLIRCHIENFGKLNNVELSFDESCHVICKENGWGKSTLATFLRVMFFGFNNENKRDAVENERRHYEPWQKGVYGGSVTFEINGTVYEMSRQFAKKEADDVFELRLMDTNLVSTDFSKKIGEEIFQIDGESFQRTVFISQQQCDTHTTDSINAKMGNLVNNTDDINNFANVYEKLKKTTDSMTPGRKTGSLNKLKQELTALKYQLSAEEDIAKRMEDTEKLREMQCDKSREEQAKINELEAKQQVLAGDMDVREKRAEYQAICDVWQQEKDALATIKSRFANSEKIPQEEELLERQTQEKNCRDLLGFVRQNTLSEDDRLCYEQWKSRFLGRVPTEEELTEKEKENEELQRLRRELAANSLSPEEYKTYEMLLERYGENPPTESEILALRSRLEDAKRKEEGLVTKRATLSTLAQMAEQKAKKGLSPLLLIGIVVTCIGIGGLFVQMIAGVLGIALGILLAGIGLFTGRKAGTSKEENQELQTLATQIEEDERFIKSVSQDVNVFLSPYQAVLGQMEPGFLLGELLHEISRFTALKAKKGTPSQGGSEERCEQLAQSLRVFVDQYELGQTTEDNMGTQLARIRTESAKWQRWHQAEMEYKKAKEAYDTEYGELTAYLSSIGYDEVSDAEMLLEELKRLVSDYQNANVRYAQANVRKEDFERNYDVKKLQEVREEADDATLGQLTDAIRELRGAKELAEQRIREYDKRLEEDQEQWDEIQQLRAEYEEKKERFDTNKKKYDLLRKTMDFLQEAKDSLTARYMEPVKQGFDKYYQMITENEATAYRFDAGANLTVEEKGMQRDVRFLSEGYQDLVGVCTRMALVDAMYRDEKPFLIFDDPFVNLDTEKTEKAVAFLKQISQEYQVIYFTCHDSRR